MVGVGNEEGREATEQRAAFGVRAACCRSRMWPDGRVLQTCPKFSGHRQRQQAARTSNASRRGILGLVLAVDAWSSLAFGRFECDLAAGGAAEPWPSRQRGPKNNRAN